jgi:hypothetical protein
MAAPRNRRHILVALPPEAEGFTSRRSGRAKPFDRPADRVQHAQRLTQGLTTAADEAAARRAAEGAAPAVGILVQFEAPPGVDLKLESLENKHAGIEVRGVHRSRPSDDQPYVETATVFIPERKVGHFLNRFQQYANENTAKGQPKHRELVDRIQSIRMATLRALWTDDQAEFPAENALTWWEVWLRRDDGAAGAEIERLETFAAAHNIALGTRHLLFDDRTVCLVHATAEQLSASVDVLGDLAELRKAKTGNAFFADLTPAEQAAWADDLLGRLTLPGADAPAVCVLDTGVTRDHPLIAPALAVEDASAINATWGSHDNGGGPGQAGHGTEMAGLALYGDLGPVLQSADAVLLRHRLESVKILPPAGHQNHPDLYGAITAEATSRPEIQAPHRRRVFSMAVTAPADGERGQPTSWSASVDALAAGRSFDANTEGLVYLDQADRDAHRLFVLSAGNVPEARLQADHLTASDLEPVQDPAHAWNALTVGACTERAVIEGGAYDGWAPVANSGDLSPWSATGVTMSSKWPNKPDVVFEGGNVGTDGQGFDGGVADLCLLSTFYQPIQKLFVLTNATSAATAQVARMGAVISAEYATLWPETLRALIVHSAEWTPIMQAAIDGAGSRQAIAALLRRYGFGRPALSRALRSAADALTLISQSVIHPYREGKAREMHLHRLPWPKEALQALGDQDVTLRVTLSYFIEPNPARRGWRARHRYASHGLRFDVKTGEESLAEFRRRLNKQAVAEDGEQPTTSSDSAEWVLGDQLRHRGSLHGDIWHGSAAELADRGVIGIYPVSGWWKEQPKRDRSEFGARYALVVSIQTAAEGVDIWTPVAQQVGVPVQNVEIEL